MREVTLDILTLHVLRWGVLENNEWDFLSNNLTIV